MNTHTFPLMQTSRHLFFLTCVAAGLFLFGCSDSSSNEGEPTTESDVTETDDIFTGGDTGGIIPGASCKTDGDCPTSSAQGQCQIGICDPETLTCTTQNREDGTACDDGNQCLEGDTCLNGVCESGTTPSCEDEGACEACPDVCPCPNTCGDGTCDPNESIETCPEDCEAVAPEVCGDSACTPSESCTNCPEDCGECPAGCGNGACEDGEDCTNCESDCGACPETCGDGVCSDDETCTSCSDDCGECTAECGNGACEDGEDCLTCPADCDDVDCCGDGTCGAGEDCLSCEADCGPCVVCGDGTCDGSESCLTCEEDCGECGCLPSTEPGPAPTGNALCMVHGCSGETVDCLLQIARADVNGEAATGLQAVLQYDPTLLELDNFYDTKCFAVDLCSEVPLAKGGSQSNDTGHSFSFSPAGETPCSTPPCLWNGTIQMVIFNLAGVVSLSEAYLDENGSLVGDGTYAWARFTLLQDIESDAATPVSFSDAESDDLVAVGASLLELPASVQNGIVVTEDAP